VDPPSIGDEEVKTLNFLIILWQSINALFLFVIQEK
jgi:hypothetical protein